MVVLPVSEAVVLVAVVSVPLPVPLVLADSVEEADSVLEAVRLVVTLGRQGEALARGTASAARTAVKTLAEGIIV
jgi:hypothetical protein